MAQHLDVDRPGPDGIPARARPETYACPQPAPCELLDRALAAQIRAAEELAHAEQVRDRCARLRRERAACVRRVSAGQTAAEARAAHLEQALHSNRRVGMALGLLMMRFRLGERAAFELLREMSNRHNVKMRDLAEDIIGTGTLEGPAA